jgi:hypothetical protein
MDICLQKTRELGEEKFGKGGGGGGVHAEVAYVHEGGQRVTRCAAAIPTGYSTSGDVC